MSILRVVNKKSYFRLSNQFNNLFLCAVLLDTLEIEKRSPY